MVAPTGTVTFLFTDIEGSTRLWDTERDAMALALVKHDSILSESLARFDGHLVKSTGDGVLAAFEQPLSAVKACVNAQQELNMSAWPTSRPVRVRMGMHSGVADHRGGDYFGPPLNRAARLMSLGAGGQVLLSETTTALLDGNLPSGTSLRKLGTYSLKDLSKPEVVFQLDVDALTKDFPPIQTSGHVLERKVPSIAVLPLMDRSPDGKWEYLADGIAEEILCVLAGVSGIRVASRTSAFVFKGKDLPIGAIAKQLGVENVLEGSIQVAGTRLRARIRLVDAQTDRQIWSTSYENTLEDLFKVQDEIAQRVVAELRLAFWGEAPDDELRVSVKKAQSGRETSTPALLHFLQGRFHAARGRKGDIQEAIRHYELAIEADKGYALAWAGRARAYTLAANRKETARLDGFAIARESGARALELAPNLADAYMAVAGVAMYADRKWSEAESFMRTALELAPSNAEILSRMSLLQGYLGYPSEALRLNKLAVLVDPLSLPAYRNLAWHSLNAGDIEEARGAVEKLFSIDANGELAHYFKGNVLLLSGDPLGALSAFQEEYRDTYRLLGVVISLHALDRCSESDDAQMEMIDKFGALSSFEIAASFAYRGMADKAFEWINNAFDRQDPGVCELTGAFHFKSIRADTRWKAVMRRLAVEIPGHEQ